MFDGRMPWELAHSTQLTAPQELTQDQKQRDVYETHRHRVFSVSYYMTSNELEAEQILTGTFIDTFRRQQEPDGHAIDQALLRELEERFPIQEAAAPATATGPELVRRQIRRTDMEEAVATLPPRERLIFLLHDVEGFGVERIAGLLHCEESEVGRTLLSARIRMRNAVAAAQRDGVGATV